MELTLESQFALRRIELLLQGISLTEKEELAKDTKNILKQISFYEGFKNTNFCEYKATAESILYLQTESEKIDSMKLDKLKEYFLEVCRKLEMKREEFKQLVKGEK